MELRELIKDSIADIAESRVKYCSSATKYYSRTLLLEIGSVVSTSRFLIYFVICFVMQVALQSLFLGSEEKNNYTNLLKCSG